MLVLTRKPGEKIFIGDNVSLTVVEVKGDSVRIGWTHRVTLKYIAARFTKPLSQLKNGGHRR